MNYNTQYLVSLVQEFNSLTDKKKELILEYYNLITSSSIPLDEEFERISEIWNEAENEPQLCKFLEIIDSLYTNLPEEDEKFESDRRAYYSEYIGLLAEQKQKGKKTTIILNKNFTGDASFLKRLELLRCPNGLYTFASLSFGDMLCSQCHQKMEEHTTVLQKIGQ